MKKTALFLAVLMLACVLFGCGAKLPVIKSDTDLEGKNIGVQLGTTGDIYVSDGAIKDAKALAYKTAVDAALALKDGKVDAVVIDEEPAKNIIAANKGLTILESELFGPENYAIAVKKGDADLLAAINTVLAEIKTDGTYDRLVEGFIDTPEADRAPYITGAQTGSKGTLKMGTNAAFAPFEYLLEDGKTAVGFDVEIAKLVAKKLDMTLEVVDMDFDSLLIALQSGQVDMVLAGMTITEDRLTSVDFSDSYYTSNQVIIVRAE